MKAPALVGYPLLLIAGYFLFKWLFTGVVQEEQLVAWGGLYHWSGLTLLAIGWTVWIRRNAASSGSLVGDMKQLAKPLMLYAFMASVSVWAWNHMLAKESTALRKAIRLAQIDTLTSTSEAYAEFLAQHPAKQREAFPDRLSYKAQAQAQVEWMMSGSLTLVLSLVMYMLASVVLVVVSALLLHHIWGVATLG